MVIKFQVCLFVFLLRYFHLLAKWFHIFSLLQTKCKYSVLMYGQYLILVYDSVHMLYIYIIKASVCLCVCLSVCGHSNVLTLTSPPVLSYRIAKGTYGFLTTYLVEVTKLIGETFESKKFCFFKKILYGIPSSLLSFLP